MKGPFWVGPHQPASMAEIPRAIYYPTGPDYLRTMEIPLLSGRLLSPADNLDSPVVVLVDSLARAPVFSRTGTCGPDASQFLIGARLTTWRRGLSAWWAMWSIMGSTARWARNHSFTYSIYQLPDEALPVFRSVITVAVRTRPGRCQLDAGPQKRGSTRQAAINRFITSVRCRNWFRDRWDGSASRCCFW